MNPSSPATNNLKPSNKKVFDIVRPGKPMATPSSRPIIVTNKPEVVDKQVTPAQAPQSSVLSPGVSLVSTEPRIRNAVKPPSAPRLQKTKVTMRPLMSHRKAPINKAPQSAASAAAPAGTAPSAPTVPKKIALKDIKAAASAVLAESPAKPQKSTAPKKAEAKSTPKPKAEKIEKKPEPVAVSAPAPAVVSRPVAQPPVDMISEPLEYIEPTPVKKTSEPELDSLLEPLTDEEMEAIRTLSDTDKKPEPKLAPAPKPEADLQEDTPDALPGAYKDGTAGDSEKGSAQSEVSKEAPAPDAPETVGIPNKVTEFKHEDIMAGAGMVMPKQEEAAQPARPIAVHHRHKLSWWKWLLVVLLIVVLGLVAFNFLIDAELLKVNVDLPTTNLL